MQAAALNLLTATLTALASTDLVRKKMRPEEFQGALHRAHFTLDQSRDSPPLPTHNFWVRYRCCPRHMLALFCRCSERGGDARGGETHQASPPEVVARPARASVPCYRCTFNVDALLTSCWQSAGQPKKPPIHSSEKPHHASLVATEPQTRPLRSSAGCGAPGCAARETRARRQAEGAPQQRSTKQ